MSELPHKPRGESLSFGTRLRALAKEPWVRFCLLFPGSRWRDPTLFAHDLVGDDFWILSGRWDTYCKKIAPERIHPRLGWIQGPITFENPLGLVPETALRLTRDGRPKVLFYGDSFVGGPARPEHWLPTLLEKQFEGLDVLHLGVGGYGPDQAHLLLKETATLVDRPQLILMGVMTFSFDRAGQGVRSYQKPRLALREGGELEVTNVPIQSSPERFFREAKLSFSSYALAAERNRGDPHRLSGWTFEDKVAVNRAIIEANRREARALGAPLMYVIFYDHEQLLRPGSRERFFRESLPALGVDVFDTAPALLDYVRAHDIDAKELYDNGHHTELGNRVIAEALAKTIEQRTSLRRTAALPSPIVVARETESVEKVVDAQPAPAPSRASHESHWFPVAFRRDLEPGRVERVKILGRALALFLDANGAPAALVDRCPHRSARLSDGRVRDGTLECLYHGWRFDATGRCVAAPQQPKDVALPERACAQRVPCRVEQGLIWIWGGEPGRESEHAAPTIARFDEPSVHSIDFAMDLPYGQDYFVENVLDVAHIHVAHDGTRGGGDRRLCGPLEFKVERSGPAGFQASFRTLGLAQAPRTRGLRSAHVEFRAPNLVHYVSQFDDDRQISGLALYSLPLDAGHSRMLYRAYGNLWSDADRNRPRWREHLNQCYLLEEDMAVVRGQAQEIDESREPLSRMWLPLRTSDALVLRYREWIELHAADRIGAVGLREVGARRVLDADSKLDRWTLHTRQCADCRAAHARLARRAKGWSAASFVALAGAAAASGPLAWSGAALALALQGLARRDRRTARELTRERDLRANLPT